MDAGTTLNMGAVIFGAIAMGAIIGLIPFFIGKSRGRTTLGVVFWVLCILGNFIAGLFLSVPICLVTVIILFVMNKK